MPPAGGLRLWANQDEIVINFHSIESEDCCLIVQ